MLNKLNISIQRAAVLVFLPALMALSYTSSALAGGSAASLQKQSQSVYNYTDQIIVKYRDNSLARSAAAGGVRASAMTYDRVNALSSRAGIRLSHHRFMSGNGHVLKLPRTMTLAESRAVTASLNADPNVEYAEPDGRKFPMSTPSDPMYTNQWHYNSPDMAAGGANLPGAWSVTTGSSSVVVAVIDTGILFDHPDLSGRTVPGYDFISDSEIANDGDGRDSDPSDTGDWITTAENSATGGTFAGCGVRNSTWHGSHVAGTIGASTNNGIGVAGINWISRILPVRVLGKCGGYDSDIADGMRWAAGLAVTGVPANANPAKVMNVSLGGSGACSTTFQNAINDIKDAGSTVVVAAGNANLDVSGFTPGNCNGVISVAAVNRSGGRASYSNYGAGIKIAAPGGEQSFSGDPNGILSTLNNGATSPAAYIYQYYQGTSMATPHVAGIVSLMLSVNPSLTPSQVLSILQSSARAFPTGTGSSGGDCTTAICGAGIINAATAVSWSQPAPNVTTAAISAITETSAAGGGEVTFAGSSAVTARGICWDTATLPTTALPTCTPDLPGTGTGAFTSSITGLTSGAKYYVRAYAANSSGTSYGNEVSFTTLAVPIIKTKRPVSNVTASSAIGGGKIVSTGGSAVTVSGLCWNTSSGATINNSKTVDGALTGSFTSTITGLTTGVKYYMRAYATNSIGTGYGTETTFVTGKRPGSFTLNPIQ